MPLSGDSAQVGTLGTFRADTRKDTRGYDDGPWQIDR